MMCLAIAASRGRSSTTLLAALLASLAAATPARAVILAQHAGVHSPVLAGWDPTGGNEETGASFYDYGGEGVIDLMDPSDVSGSTRTYQYVPTAAESDLAQAHGWQLTVRLNLPEEADAPNGSVYAEYAHDTRRYGMSFGVQGSTGDPIVRTTDGKEFIVTDGRGLFHDYALVHQPGSSQPELRIDDASKISTAGGAFSQRRVVWGAGSSADTGRGRYNRVTLEIFPPLDLYLEERYGLDGNANEALSGATNGSGGAVAAADRNGQAGAALSFAAEGARVTLDNSEFEPDGRFTLAAWIRPTAHEPGDRRPILSKWDGAHAGSQAGAIVLETAADRDDGLVRLRLTVFDESDRIRDVVSSRPLRIDAWNHVAARVVSGHMTLFIDGIPAGHDAINSPTIAPTTYKWGIGCDGSAEPSEARRFRGSIDEVQFFSAALSDTEIAQVVGQRAIRCIASSVEDGAQRVALDEVITLGFDAAPDSDSLQPGAVTLVGSLSGEIAATFALAGSSLEISPDSAFAAGETVRVSISESLSAADGRRATPKTLAFQTVPPAQEDLYARQTGSRAFSQLGLLVDGAVGAFSQELDLMTVESVRPINLKLRYNSLLDRVKSHVGYGWTHSFLSRLEENDDGSISVYFDSSRYNVFNETDTPGTYASADFEARFDRLNQQAYSGFPQTDNWVLRRKNGTIYVFAPRGNLLGIGNEAGQFVVAEYEATRLVGVRDQASDRGIRFAYDAETGLVASLFDGSTNPESSFRDVFLHYDAAQRLAVAREPVVADARFYLADIAAQAIPDNDPAGLTIELEIDGDEPVGIVTIDNLSFSHPRPEDLEFILESPSGTQATIANRQPEPTGAHRLVPLFEFEGENPEGTWILRAYDRASGEFGTLTGFSLGLSATSNPIHFAYTEPSPLGPAGSSRLLGATDALGDRLFAVEYDGQKRVVAQDDGRDDTPKSSFAYDASNPNRIQTIYTDRAGEQWQLVHDKNLKLLSNRNPLGGVASWAYDENGLCISTTDPLGRQTRFAYNDEGRMTSATDPTGIVTEFEYLGSQIHIIRDEAGNETRLEYSSGSLNLVADALGYLTRRSYSSDGELQEVEMPDGAEIDYTWTNGLLRSAKRSQIPGLEASLAYDPAGRPLKITDGEGYSTEVRYRPNGEIVQRIDPLGNETNKRYDHRSRLIEQENKKGFSILFEYDGNDNLVRGVDPDGRESRFAFDAEDRMISELSFDGLETRYEYNAAGLMTAAIRPNGVIQRYAYDAAGNRVATIDHDGVTVESVRYNERDQPVAITDAWGNTLTVEYDALGRERAMVDARGRRTTFSYDELDRLVAVTDPAGRTFTQSYHSDDLPFEITQPNGDSVRLSYDNANRPTGEEAAFYSTTSDRYDGRDLLIVDELAGGAELRMTYDELGRVQQIDELPTGDPDVIERTVFYGYDDNDNIASLTANEPDGDRPSMSASRTFDDLDRITSYTDENGSSLAYAYNENGTLRRLTYPDGKTVEYSYDELNRLASAVDWAGRETNFAYNDLDRLESIAFPNGAYRLMEYDQAGRIQQRTDYAADDSIIVQYSYERDERSNIMIESSGHDVPGYEAPAVAMTYQNGDRLDTFNGLDVQIDMVGNMTRGPIDGTPVDFVHDLRGRLREAGEVTYTYSPEDRLSGWQVDGQQTTFVTNPAVGVTQVLVKRDPDGANTRYVYGVGLLYEDGPDGLRVYHYDERGSALAYSGPSGNVLGRVAYGPWGEVYHQEGWTDSIFKFNGLYGVIEGPQGLNYMRYRWYSPEIKRFTRLDAHFGNIADIGTLNRYVFAGGNPANRIDPSGEFWAAVGAFFGATTGLTVEFIFDIADDGKINTDPADYAAAALGGAVTGGMLVLCPTCGVSAGALGAAVTNLTAAGLKGESIDGYSLAADVLVGGAAGALGNAGKFGSKGGGRFARGVGKQRLASGFTTPSASTLGRSAAPKRATATLGVLRRAIPKTGAAIKDFGVDVASGLTQEVFATGVEAGLRFVGENITDIFFDPQILLIDRYQSANANAATGNVDALNRARYEQGQGTPTLYGEFNHWRLYRGFLELALEPVPATVDRQLHAF